MSLFNSVASWFLKKRIYQIEMFMKHPEETQAEVLHDLVQMAEGTAFGLDHGFKDIKSIAQFQERIPIHTYEDIFPYIDRCLQGEPSVLWPGDIKWFSKSSGTTNDKSKFIPVTPESLDNTHFRGGKDMLALYVYNNPNSKIFDGKGLPIAGSHQINKLNNQSYAGDLSAVLIQNTPFVFNRFRATSKKISLIGEWEEKIEAIARKSLDTKVTTLAGIPTWSLVLIEKVLELAKNENRNLMEVWPNLEVYFHGGVSFLPYRKQFDALIPPGEITYFELYNASEGFFAMQNDPHSNDLLLMLDYGIFYEFIPLDELDKDHPKALTIGEVELGETYAMVISTDGGLWRYLIGDTVEFTSVRPYKVKVAGRTKHFINAFGEELMVQNAEAALTETCEATGALIDDYTAGPFFLEEGGRGGHEWLIEFKTPPADLDRFAEILDSELKKQNSDYEAKRYESMVLQPPILRAVPKGTFYNWMKKRDKLGGQNKVPRLSNKRTHLESILEMLQIEA